MGVCKLKEGGGACPRADVQGWAHFLQWWLLQLPPKGLAVLQTTAEGQAPRDMEEGARQCDLGVAGGPHLAAELRESGLGQGSPHLTPGELLDGVRWEVPSTLGQRSSPFLKGDSCCLRLCSQTRGPKELGPMFSEMRERAWILDRRGDGPLAQDVRIT